MMKVRIMEIGMTEEQTIEIEWWKYRNGSEAERGMEASIWAGAGIGMKTPKMEKLMYVP